MYLTQLLHRQLQQQPDAVMTVNGDRARTVRESAQRIARLAGALQGLGVSRGEHIGILALNSDRYHEYLLAVPWADAVVAPVNIRWSPAEIIYSLKDASVKCLLVDDVFIPMIPALQQACPELATIIFCGDGPTPTGAHNYEELVTQGPAVEDARRGGDDVFGIFYTGGTTGTPKGVMLSHTNVMVSNLGMLASADTDDAGGVAVLTAPMFHMAAVGCWITYLMTDAKIIFAPGFDPVSVVTMIDKYKVTSIMLVPTMLQYVLEAATAMGTRLPSLKYLTYGASAMPNALLLKTLALIDGVKLLQAFGMTELSPVATLLTWQDHQDPEIMFSSGRAPINCEVKVVDLEDNEVPIGDVGEVVVKGSNVMVGYLNKPEATAEALRGGWMHTGDIGYMTERGYLFVVDRLKDMIITGGENVYSVEVENALASHPAVASVAVIAIPSGQWGEAVHAAVILAPGQSVTDEELRAYCGEQIARYKVPRTIEFRDAFPLSGAGKILKREIRKEYQELASDGTAR